MKEVITKQICPRRINIKTTETVYTSPTGEKLVLITAAESDSELLKEDINKVITEIEEDIDVETAKVISIKKSPLDKDGFSVCYIMHITMKETAQA